MKKNTITIITIVVILLGVAAVVKFSPDTGLNTDNTANAKSVATIVKSKIASDEDKPSDDLLKPGQQWEKYRTSGGEYVWIALPVEPDPTPLGSVIVKTFDREDGTTYGVDEHGYYGKSEMASKLSTTEPPTVEDFDWFFNDVQTKGVPFNAENIHHPEDAIGDWKCLVVVDPLNKKGKLTYHFGTLDMNCKKYNGVEELSPMIEWNYKLDSNMKNKTDESGNNAFLGSGSFSDGWCGGDGNGNISFRMWTLGDGRQYAWGAAKLSDGSDNFVVLVR